MKKSLIKVEIVCKKGCDFLFTEDKLPQESKQHIINITDELRQRYNINPMNFDVIKFLKEIECFSVEACSFKDKNITGVLLVDEERPSILGSEKIIAINDTIVNNIENGIQKTRFIALHEWGHYVLHKKDKKQFAMRDTGHLMTQQEYEAEFFAYCMIMPIQLISQLLHDLGHANDFEKIDYISRSFGVTKNKASSWLRELNVIG